MPEIVESETYLLPFRKYSCLHCSGTEILLHEDRSRQRLLTLEACAGKNKILLLGIRRLISPSKQETCQQRMHRNWCFRGLGLRYLEAAPHIRTPYMHRQVIEIQIGPLQAKDLGHPQSGRCIAQHERAARLRNVDENLKGLLGRHDQRLIVACRSLAHPIHGIAFLLPGKKIASLAM